MGVIRIAAAWLAAVVFMALAGTAVQTGFVLGALADVGAPVTSGDALGMIAADLAGLAPIYGALIAIAFAAAFLAGGLVVRFSPLPRFIVYGGAGLIAMAVMLAAMEPVFSASSPSPVPAAWPVRASRRGWAACPVSSMPRWPAAASRAFPEG